MPFWTFLFQSNTSYWMKYKSTLVKHNVLWQAEDQTSSQKKGSRKAASIPKSQKPANK